MDEEKQAQSIPQGDGPAEPSSSQNEGNAEVNAEQLPSNTAQQVTPQASAPTPQNTPDDSKPKKKRTGCIIAVIVVVVLFFIMTIAIGTCSSSSSSSSESTSQSTSATTSASTSSTSSVSQTVNKAELQTALTKAAGIDAAAYTPESYSALVSVTESGQQVMNDPNATQASVTSAATAINNAISNLQEAFNPANYAAIPYADIARNPDSYTGQNLVFSGRVLQVLEGSSENDVRLATDGGYDDVVFVAYDPQLLDFRILEDDNITVYGTCTGLYSYKATLGQTITLPSMIATQVVLN